MADSATPYAHQQQAIFAAQAIAGLTFYVALFVDSANPNNDGTEFAMPGYARQVLNYSLTGSTLSNPTDIAFPDLGNSPWGGSAVFDALTGGNQWYFQDYNPRLSISSAIRARVLAAGLQVILS